MPDQSNAKAHADVDAAKVEAHTNVDAQKAFAHAVASAAETEAHTVAAAQANEAHANVEASAARAHADVESTADAAHNDVDAGKPLVMPAAPKEPEVKIVTGTPTKSSDKPDQVETSKAEPEKGSQLNPVNKMPPLKPVPSIVPETPTDNSGVLVIVGLLVVAIAIGVAYAFHAGLLKLH